METEHKKELRERFLKENKKFYIEVENFEDNVLIQTKYKSIEEALHKIELDLMTNLHFGFLNPIKIRIAEVEV